MHGQTPKGNVRLECSFSDSFRAFRAAVRKYGMIGVFRSVRIVITLVLTQTVLSEGCVVYERGRNMASEALSTRRQVSQHGFHDPNSFESN